MSVAANAAIAERYPRVIADIVASGHEIIAHSAHMNGTIAIGSQAMRRKAADRCCRCT